jgi:IMP cyclohydrolase
MVATYEKTEFIPIQILAKNAAEIAKGFFELEFEKPVCAAAAMALQNDKRFELAIYNPASEERV